MKALAVLLSLHEVCQFQTKEGEKYGLASKSELKRWLLNKAVHVNFQAIGVDDEWPPVVKSIVLFPKGKNRTTLFYDESITLIQLPEPEKS